MCGVCAYMYVCVREKECGVCVCAFVWRELCVCESL